MHLAELCEQGRRWRWWSKCNSFATEFSTAWTYQGLCYRVTVSSSTTTRGNRYMHLLVRVLVLIRDWSSLRKQQVGASQLVVKDHIAMVWLTRPHQLLPSLTKLIHRYLLHICHFEKVFTRNKPNYWTTHSSIFWTPKCVQQIPKCCPCSWQILDMPHHRSIAPSFAFCHSCVQTNRSANYFKQNAKQMQLEMKMQMQGIPHQCLFVCIPCILRL